MRGKKFVPIITAADMRRMNHAVDVLKQRPADVAGDFVGRALP